MSAKRISSDCFSYNSKDFSSSFELAKKIILDLADEREEYDIIVKKIKISNGNQIMIQTKQEETYEEPLRIEKKIKNRHKNTPKLFGQAFFRMLLKNKMFQNKYLTEDNLSNLAPEGINYPAEIEVVKNKISINSFIQWVKNKNFHLIYSNLHFYREIWNYKKIDENDEEGWIYQHYKYFMKTLMKEFFELYACPYVFGSKIQAKNGIKYLNLIPHFLRGMEDPENFSCLKYKKLNI